MNDEIKEILDMLKDKCKYIEDYGYQYKRLSLEDTKILLDYITNLQQKNEEWAMIFDTFSKRPYAHKYLEEKRKELGNDKIIGLDSEMIYKDYYDYKSRVEKAVEKLKREYYINEHEWNDRTINEVLNILQNGSEE